MNSVKLTQYDNTFCLTQDLTGLNLYQRTKAIKQFIKSETKILEECVDNYIRAIFAKNGINVYETTESALNERFSALKRKGIEISIIDRYKNLQEGVIIGITDSEITCVIDDDNVISCAIEIKEVKK